MIILMKYCDAYIDALNNLIKMNAYRYYNLFASSSNDLIIA